MTLAQVKACQCIQGGSSHLDCKPMQQVQKMVYFEKLHILPLAVNLFANHDCLHPALAISNLYQLTGRLASVGVLLASGSLWPLPCCAWDLIGI
jgi:hypothetical protein